MKSALNVLFIVISLASCHSLSAATHYITLANGKSFDLKLPDGFGISVAAQGLKRVRFMARSPADRIFVTDMYNLTDNKRGVVYILEDFDPATREFKTLTKYLTGLRNPNSIAFYTDGSGTSWFYLALTDRLVRQAGSKVFSDPKFNLRNKKFDCRKVPAAHTPLPAHGSPLGFEYFDSTSDPVLANSFLVALHGSTKRS